jgi:HipA-like protein
MADQFLNASLGKIELRMSSTSESALFAEPDPAAKFDSRLQAPPSATVARVRAIEFVRRMRGASQPFLMRCDDGGTYVVKFRNNPQHIKVLANELLAGCLARLIGLAVPGPAIVEVSAPMVEKNAQLEFVLGERRENCLPGLQFGSRYPGGEGSVLVVDFLPDRLLRRVMNVKGVFLGAYVFDKWTCNCDGRQVVFFRSAEQEERGYSAALIDHGFCFNDGEWNFPDSPIRSLYPRRLVYESVRALRSFEPYLSQVENLAPHQIEECVRAVPQEWCGEDSGQLARLAERLYERRRRVRQMIIEARDSSLRPFPNWG